MNDKKILITGGAGYIGSIVARLLLEANKDIVILDKFSFGKKPIIPLKYFYKDRIKLIEGDIRNKNDVQKSLENIDTVVHLAAIVGDPACSVNAEMSVDTNLTATKNLVDESKSRGISKFIFSSTCSVYGCSEKEIFEESEVSPVSLYGVTKHDAEKYIIQESSEKFKTIILRLGTVYGISPRMRFDLVINYLTQRACIEGNAKIFGGEQWRPFVHVSDIAQCFKLFALSNNISDNNSEIINIGFNDQNYKMKELIPILKEIIPHSNLELIEEVKDTRSYNVNFSKLQSLIPIKNKYTVKDGIQEIRNSIYQSNLIEVDSPIYYNYRVWD